MSPVSSRLQSKVGREPHTYSTTIWSRFHRFFRLGCGSRPDRGRPAADHLSGFFRFFDGPALRGRGEFVDDHRHGLSDVCLSGLGDFACRALAVKALAPGLMKTSI
jgi:hypothetical protein